MAKIQKIEIQKVLGFRSSETIRADVFSEDNELASAFVAFGKSEGKYEAKYIQPDEAVLKSGLLTLLLRGTEVSDQAGIDEKMIKADATAQKENFGANTMLGVSIACAKLAAKTQKKELFQHFSELLFGETQTFQYQPPKILFNLIEGGVHANNNLPIQEHLLISGRGSVKDQVAALDNVFDAMSDKLEAQDIAVGYGDEGGFINLGVSQEDSFLAENQIFSLMNEFLQPGDGLGVDVAANNIKDFDAEKYFKYYRDLFKNFPFLYFEDPFPEEGFNPYWQDFCRLFSQAGGLTVGDDLTVTNPEKFQEVLRHKLINAIIIKPDQIGTLTETLATVRLAKINDVKIIVSHRSQETDDDFLADLAVGVNADFVKFGAFYQGERLAKYNRLLAIENFV